jgi:hypothetical protein
MAVRMVPVAVISVGFLAGMPTANGFAAAAIGTTLGVVLATYGLKHTTYDVTAGTGYTPSPWIGLIVTAVFLGRFAARMFSVYEARALSPSGSPAPSFQRSPLTLGIFFLMASYYTAYYAGVLRKAPTMGATAEPSP